MTPLTIEQAKDKAAQELCGMDWCSAIQLIYFMPDRFSIAPPEMGTITLVELAMDIHTASHLKAKMEEIEQLKKELEICRDPFNEIRKLAINKQNDREDIQKNSGPF